MRFFTYLYEDCEQNTESSSYAKMLATALDHLLSSVIY
jgi:hypothetical protein